MTQSRYQPTWAIPVSIPSTQALHRPDRARSSPTPQSSGRVELARCACATLVPAGTPNNKTLCRITTLCKSIPKHFLPGSSHHLPPLGVISFSPVPILISSSPSSSHLFFETHNLQDTKHRNHVCPRLLRHCQAGQRCMPSLNLPRVVLIAMGHLCSILISRAVTITPSASQFFALSDLAPRKWTRQYSSKMPIASTIQTAGIAIPTLVLFMNSADFCASFFAPLHSSSTRISTTSLPPPSSSRTPLPTALPSRSLASPATRRLPLLL